MPNRGKTYWRLFNVLGRIVGVLFTLGGAIFIIYGLTSASALVAVVGLVVAVLGILLVFAKPFRPDFRDSGPPESINGRKDE
jgi:hypothetical protein